MTDPKSNCDFTGCRITKAVGASCITASAEANAADIWVQARTGNDLTIRVKTDKVLLPDLHCMVCSEIRMPVVDRISQPFIFEVLPYDCGPSITFNWLPSHYFIASDPPYVGMKTLVTPPYAKTNSTFFCPILGYGLQRDYDDLSSPYLSIDFNTGLIKANINRIWDIQNIRVKVFLKNNFFAYSNHFTGVVSCKSFQTSFSGQTLTAPQFEPF